VMREQQLKFVSRFRYLVGGGFSRRGAFVCAAEIPLHFFDTVGSGGGGFCATRAKRSVKHTRSQPGLLVGTVGASAPGDQHTTQ
jgi:hypothetical protein